MWICVSCERCRDTSLRDRWEKKLSNVFTPFITWTFLLPLHLALGAVGSASCCHGSHDVIGCLLRLDVKWLRVLTAMFYMTKDELFFSRPEELCKNIFLGMLDSCYRCQTCKWMVTIMFIFLSPQWGGRFGLLVVQSSAGIKASNRLCFKLFGSPSKAPVIRSSHFSGFV